MQIPIKADHPLNAMLLAHADSERVNKSGGVYHAPAGKEDHPVSVFHLLPPTAIFTPLVNAPSQKPAPKPSIRSAVANLFSRGGNRG